MGRVRAFNLPGLACWFYSGDHRPPHFHVQSPGEWEVRVFFLQEPIGIEVKFRMKRIPGGILRTVGELARTHRVELLREWEANAADD
jgi:hypothetical protein